MAAGRAALKDVPWSRESLFLPPEEVMSVVIRKSAALGGLEERELRSTEWLWLEGTLKVTESQN